MSPIGRIFIVLNLILSAAFLGWASNALNKSEEHKLALQKEQKAHSDDVAAKEAELSDLQVKLNDVTEQQRQFREQRDGFETEANRLKTQLEELKRANDTMQGNLTKIQATLGDYNSTIAQLTQQKDAAVERAHEAERARDSAVQEKDAAEVAQRDAEEQAKNADLRIGDLSKQVAGLSEELGLAKTRFDMLIMKTGLNPAEIMTTPPIDALVMDVNRDLKLVFLNRGKKDAVKQGYVFSVYRGSQFKGQVRIQDVQENMSSGLILNEKTTIASGDSATTALGN